MNNTQTAKTTQKPIESQPEITAELEQLIWQNIPHTTDPTKATLKEYDLLKCLAQAGYEQFKLGNQPLHLFQAHFMLFHLLYRLQNKWFQAGLGILHIHSLKIEFEPFEKAENLPKSPAPGSKSIQLEHFDPLKAYYLDFSAYYQTQTEEVQQLLESFWHAFARQSISTSTNQMSYQQALSLFELSPPFSPQQLKQRYRQLRQATHPDRGGSAETFQKVQTAYQCLQTHSAVA